MTVMVGRRNLRRAGIKRVKEEMVIEEEIEGAKVSVVVGVLETVEGVLLLLRSLLPQPLQTRQQTPCRSRVRRRRLKRSSS